MGAGQVVRLAVLEAASTRCGVRCKRRAHNWSLYLAQIRTELTRRAVREAIVERASLGHLCAPGALVTLEGYALRLLLTGGAVVLLLG